MTTRNSTPSGKVIKSQLGKERWIKMNTFGVPPNKKQIKANQTGYQSVPWINIKGKWLEEAGFKMNQSVRIRVMKGCLVLTLEEEPKSEYEIAQKYLKNLVPQ